MKKNYFIALLALVVNLVSAQIEPTTYRGAFAPNSAMWTDTWTNWDPKTTTYTDATVVNVTTNISTNTTWTTGKTYYLNGLIYVINNATLTIQPGVIIKGNSSSSGTALVITKGAKLNAIGTVSSPIVFTSAKPVGSRAPQDWGGVILLGKAGFNLNDGINNIEGITSNVNTEYGGGLTPDDNDSSGTMKYVRIEFAGFVFSPNNEINGLTFGAVGRGTTIDYVQVSYAGDDSFEWFGGSVNCKHLVAYRGLDDDFDTDNGFKGIVQFILGIRDPEISDNPSISTSEGFESDNNAGGTTGNNSLGTAYDITKCIFTNCTLIGPAYRATLSPTLAIASGHARPARLRRAGQQKIYNSLFLDYKNNFLFVDGTVCVANATAGTLVFKNNILSGALLASDAAFSGGVNPASLNSWFTASGNTTQYGTTGSANLLVKAYDSTSSLIYTGLDYRPSIGSPALSGADFTDSYLSPYVVLGGAPVVSNKTYCKGDVASQLTATATIADDNIVFTWYNVTVNATTGVKTYTKIVLPGTTTPGPAPTPLTSTPGTKIYAVTQKGDNTPESAKAEITITVNALPLDVLNAITGTDPNGLTTPAIAYTAVGKYVGTTSQFTYTASGIDTTTSTSTYFWTVPNGVNIVSGQGTATLVVNYANVPAGAGAVGSISVQASNGICKTVAKTLAITKALPTAPATLMLYDKNSATPNTAITAFGKFMGQSNELTLTAGISPAASAYKWELPAGVNVFIPAGTTPVTTTNTYTAEPFLSPNATPTAIATKYWVVTYNKYTYNVNGVATTTTISTAVQKLIGSERTYTFTITAGDIGANAVGTLFTYNGDTYKLKTATTSSSTSVVCNASAVPQPAGNYPSGVTTTINGTLTRVYDGATTPFTKIVKAGYDATTSQAYAPYGTVVTSDLPSILVNFAGVTNSTTTKLYLGVKAVNGVGSSATSNATNADVVANNNIPGLFYSTYTETYVAPNATTLTNGSSTFTASGTTPSTAKLLTLIAALPLAPASVTLTNPALPLPVSGIPTAITVISKYIGTNTPLTLTAAVSVAATSYNWELPTWVNVVSGDVTKDRVLTVNFNGNATAPAPAGVTSYYIGVKAVNGIGSSVTDNSLLSPTTSSTAKLLKVTTSLPTAVATVTGQIAGLCAGQTVFYTFIASPLANTYTITAPVGSIVTSSNNSSNTSNVLTNSSDLDFTVTFPTPFVIGTTTPTADKTISIVSKNGVGSSAPKVLALTTVMPAIGVVTGATTYQNCLTQTFSIPAVPGAASYTWTVDNFASIVTVSPTTSIEVDFSECDITKGINVSVKATNVCGINTALKKFVLTNTACLAPKMASTASRKVNTIEVYPNPANYTFNANITLDSNDDVTMSIVTIDGSVVSSRKLNVTEGLNTISENISSLKTGIYLVQFVNSTTNETVVKKLVKN